MTRINLVPPSELCDQHLLAEFRELTRIPNGILNWKFSFDYTIPAKYCLGAGHVKFFLDKLKFLHDRYISLEKECRTRGFNVKDIWPHDSRLDDCYAGWNDYIPTEEAIALNRARIAEKMPKNPRFTPKAQK